MPLESQETVWAAPGVSGAHRVGACQSPGPHVIMNELVSYIRVESNDSSWSTFVGCQGVALPCSDDWLTKMQPWVDQWEQADEHGLADPATAFGHTGMFRGTAPVGGPYPGMVPGPQIPAYTG